MPTRHSMKCLLFGDRKGYLYTPKEFEYRNQNAVVFIFMSTHHARTREQAPLRVKSSNPNPMKLVLLVASCKGCCDGEFNVIFQRATRVTNE